MKKLIFLLLCALSSLVVSAQSIAPRYGVTENDDNTGRVLTYGYVVGNDAAGNDSITVFIHDYETLLRPTANITDSVNIKCVITRAYAGDKLVVAVAKGTGSGAIRFPTASFICDVAPISTASRYTIAANKSAVFNFVFNGSKFVMCGKTIQP
jgi:hypothetical protein